eukprot:4950956-Lingulodinium_polyedra.AAC.1
MPLQPVWTTREAPAHRELHVLAHRHSLVEGVIPDGGSLVEELILGPALAEHEATLGGVCQLTC